MYKGKLVNHITFEQYECDNIRTLYRLGQDLYREAVHYGRECDLSLEIWGRVEKIWEN